MKVKCIENRRDILPTETLKKHSSYDKFPLIIGKEYVVYALSEFDDFVWYCLMDEECTTYPMWSPSMLFEISDRRLSRYWLFDLVDDYRRKDLKVPFFCFPEWIEDENFYVNLTDDDDREVEIFAKYLQLMEKEFPNRNILEKAIIGDDQWLICPFCMDAWEDKDEMNAMVTCPKCKKTFNNPRYKDELPHLH